jgi:acetyl-CoA C-acetyltransferase
MGQNLRVTSSAPLAILGGYQSDFARNLTRAGGEVADLVAEVTTGTLTAAGVGVGDIGVIHVGNAFGQLFTGQGHLGAMPATVVPELAGVPASRHEAACASGGIALLAAMADLESGRYDCALVLGVEVERNVSGTEAAALMGAAAWVGHEGEAARYPWPWAFTTLADEYDRRYGIDDAHLRAIGEINFANAKRNPNAQTRAWELTPASFSTDNNANPPVEGRLRRHDCSQVTDGAAGVVLASASFLRRQGQRASAPSAILGWGHRTVGLPLESKLAASRGDDYVMPHVRQAILDALGRARVGLNAIDAIETHDCFTPSEYLAIDHFGITAPGHSWQAIEQGTIAFDGALPVNASGGLIGVGHPVGATGVRMVLDAHRQVTGTAGDYQVPNAQRVATLNIGGSTATTVTFVVGAAA